MNFDYIYLLTFVFFFVSFISLGYMVANSLTMKSIFEMFNQNKVSINISKFINYSIYLKQRDHIAYEKLGIWRFYFPA